MKFGYSYDPNTYNISQIKFDHRISPADPCDEFSYANLDRLTMAQYGVDDTNEIFTMDDLGNRDSVNRHDGTDEDYVIDANTNRYAKVGDVNLAYDEAGNLITDKDGYQYFYDYENRIVAVNDVNGVRIVELDYDALARRIRKYDAIADANTFYYYGKDWQVACEYNDSDVFQRRFVYGNYII